VKQTTARHAFDEWYARVEEKGQNKMVLSLTIEESLLAGDDYESILSR